MLPPSLVPAVQLAYQAYPDAMVTVIDEKEIFRFVSGNSFKLFGYLPEEVIGHTFDEYFRPADVRHIRLALEDARLNGESIAITRAVLLKGGGYRRMRGPARALTDPGTGLVYELAIGWPVD